MLNSCEVIFNQRDNDAGSDRWSASGPKLFLPDQFEIDIYDISIR